MSINPSHTSVAARVLYPVVLLGGCGLASVALFAGLGPTIASVVAVTSTIVLLTFLEKRWPYTPDWRPSRRTVAIDMIHSLVSLVIAGPVVRISSFALAVWLGAQLSDWVGSTLWPSSWPIAAQVAAAIIVADLGAYGAHRFMHATSIGWRLHAVHHTPTKLYAIASGRSHPFNALLTISCESVPLIALGITPEAFALLLTFKAVNGLLQHSNLAMRPGLLSYVIATCDVHRFHHSADLEESNTNFGNTTMLWDHVFGTFYLPHCNPSSTIGIAGSDIPESYAAHLLVPFRLKHFESERAAP